LSAPAPDACEGRRVPGLGLLLSQFITATVNQRDSVELAAAGKLGEAGACLLAGSLTGNGDAVVQGGTAMPRERVTVYIRTRLEDPRLSRATIAAAHRMSPRTLDRLFSGQERSVRSPPFTGGPPPRGSGRVRPG